MNDFRRLLMQACERLSDGSTPALLFSAGTDSLTVLWSLLAIGVRPVCYTFHLEGLRHADLLCAERECRRLGIAQEVITIPRDVQTLAADVRTCVSLAGTRKTHVQCLYPFLHVLPRVNEHQVFTGLNADDWWGSAKSDAINCARDKREFDRRRRKRQADETTSGYTFWRALAESYGRELCCPYRDPDLVEWFLSQSWRDLMAPKQKQPAVTGFQDEFAASGIYRRNDNLQCGSGIREWHDVLLSEPGVNRNGRTNIVALYKDMAA